jgi:uncharacterized membrane protein
MTLSKRWLPSVAHRDRHRLPGWRAEALRTTLWLVPSLLLVGAVALFVATIEADLVIYHHHVVLPRWIETGNGNAGREVLIAIAAAVITVVGVVFSVTILALTLASQQFGPRMMRNFVRDLGNQLTLGVWVATFVYSVLVLAAIPGGEKGAFVPYVSITVSQALLLVDIVFLIFFIHHIAKTIQLPEVIAGIAADLMKAVDAEFPDGLADAPRPTADDQALAEVFQLIDEGGITIPATISGYLQFVSYRQLVAIAERSGAVIRLEHKPGHFLVSGLPLATVWPPDATPQVARAIARAHVTGPHRTLLQDPVFPIDQLVEIAIRALSPAVNDTFTALTCIDWLSAGLCRISERVLDEGVYRDRTGRVRLIEPDPSYARMVNRAHDKIRQAARGMPAVEIRLLTGIAHVMEHTVEPAQRDVLLRQAEMIARSAEEDIDEAHDREDVHRRYEEVLAIAVRLADGGSARPRWDPPGRLGSHTDATRRRAVHLGRR